MSFTSEFKEEILEKKITEKGNNIAFISGIVVSCGKIDDDNDNLIIENESYSLISALNHALFCVYGGDYELNIHVGDNGEKTFGITISRDLMRKFNDSANIIIYNGEPSHKNYKLTEVFNKEEQRYYVLATVSALGSITIPQPVGDETYSGGYHFEMAFANAKHANAVQGLLKSNGFEVKQIKRNEMYTIYIKDSERISDIMAYCGGSNAVIELNDVMIARETRNNVNRAQNCTLANMDKSIDAAQKQLEAIHKIERTIGLNSLQDKLKKIAIIRLNNPEYSLGEIGSELDEEISKSGINHRFRKIIEIAENIKE